VVTIEGPIINNESLLSVLEEGHLLSCRVHVPLQADPNILSKGEGVVRGLANLTTAYVAQIDVQQVLGAAQLRGTHCVDDPSRMLAATGDAEILNLHEGVVGITAAIDLVHLVQQAPPLHWCGAGK